MEINSLHIAVMVIGYVILALLSAGVIIKIASVYARYRATKKSAATIELKDNKVLAILQDEGETTVICRSVENLPTEDTQVAADGEEA